MKVFSVSLAAGVEVSVRGGNFFMLIDTSAPLDVSLMSGGAEIEKAESVEAGFKAHARFADLREDGGRYFDEARLLSATTQTVRVGISDGAGGYDRALGEVTSEPKLTQSAGAPVGLDALTANGFAFAGAVQQAAVAAEYPHVQALNPAGSGKVFFVDTLIVSASVAGTIAVRRYDTALTTAPVAGQSVNKNIGGAAGVLQLRSQSSAVILPASVSSLLDVQVTANTITSVDMSAPIRLSAGQGLVVVTGAVNISLYANVAWREYA